MATEEPRVDRPRAGNAPPSWAQALLPWLVRADRADNIDGDLLEEYRETMLPERGQRRADAWYVRQVAGFLWRLSWAFGVLVALQVLTRMVADVIVPPDSYQLRAILSTWGAIYAYVIAGAYAGWRTHRARTGAVVALAAHALGHTIAIAGTVGLYIALISRDSTMLRQFRVTGGWGEVWGLPLVVMPVVIVLGLAGGLVGARLRRDSQRRSGVPA
jgi:hypothetical protein